MQSAAEFEQAHCDLVHGKVPHIPRMNEYCILQQMKTVHDAWLPFKETVDSISHARIPKVPCYRWTRPSGMKCGRDVCQD